VGVGCRRSDTNVSGAIELIYAGLLIFPSFCFSFALRENRSSNEAETLTRY